VCVRNGFIVPRHARVFSPSRGILLFNVTVDESGNLLGRCVDLILLLGDGQLLEKLLQDLDGLLVLGLDGTLGEICGWSHGSGCKRFGRVCSRCQRISRRRR